MDFLAISGWETHFKRKLRRNQFRYTWTGCIWNFQYWT